MHAGFVQRVGAGLFSALVLSSCGGGDSSSAPRNVEEITVDVLPASVMGMSVGREKIDKILEDVERPYIKEVGLYSFRKEEVLQATLQLSHFSDDADWETENFRRTVAQQIVGTGDDLPVFRMGSHSVFLGGNAKQSISVWFNGPVMMVLAARIEFEQPRTLLRELVSAEIGEGLQ